MSIVVKGLHGSRRHLVRRQTSAQVTLCYLDGVAALSLGAKPPVFGQRLLLPNGWMDEDTTWYEVDLGPGHTVLDGDPRPLPPRKDHSSPLFSAQVCGHGRSSQVLQSFC